jgi:hypothetical protein
MSTPSPLSLTTRIGFAAQTVKGTYPTTPVQLARGSSADTLPEFDYVENENHMLGIHERSTAAQSVPERSSVRVPVDYELYAYPLSLPYLLFGIGFVPGTGVTAAGVTTHKLVKSNAGDAPYLTNYLRMGTGGGKWSRQVRDVRFSQLTISLSRNEGTTIGVTGMGLSEQVVTEASYTVTNEVNTMFMPFLGGLLWNLAVPGGSDYDFGLPREHTITIDRQIEEDDQLIHKFSRNDNQEMSFGITGEMRGMDFSVNVYNELFYGGAVTLVGASLSPATMLNGLTFELNTNAMIPAATVPYKFTMNIPKCEIRALNGRAQGNDIIRCDVRWKMIDDALTPPVRIELTNNVASYPYNNQLFLDAGGTLWTLPDPTP